MFWGDNLNERSNTFLETEPVGALMRRYSLPCIISLLVASLYNIADPVFIFGFGWGMMGAAVATGLGQLLTAEAAVGAAGLLIVELFPGQLIAVFGVGFALLLPVFFVLDGILLSMPVSDVLTFALSAAAAAYTMRALRRPAGA